MEQVQNSPATEPQQEPKRPQRRGWLGISLMVVLAVLVVSVLAVQVAYNKSGLTPGAGELPVAVDAPPVSAPSPAELSNSFRAVVKIVKPAVVHINTSQVVERQGSSFPNFPGFEFPRTPRRQEGTGSGFIVTQDGFILTNNHVVGDADRIDVTLSDGRKLKGKVVGTDPETDIAVVRVEASGLPTVPLGNSDSVEQGDWVLALGSPFGLQQTLTAGIVSATGRELPGSPFDRFIQTDASINPGNSGGPLVNLRGEVIGINTMIVSRTGFNEGIGFAVPSNLANKIYGGLIKNGKIVRGYLGVWIGELDPARARALHLEPNAGVLVSDVTDPNSPGAKAGLQSGDVITAVEGKPVKTPGELTNAVADIAVGKSVHVEFIRDGKRQSVNVVIGERPAQGPVRAGAAPDDDLEGGTPQTSSLGVSVQTVTPDIARENNLRVSTGAVIVGVNPGSAAAEAGLRRGDVIHRIDRTRITTAQDVVEAAKSLKSGDEVALQVERRGQMIFVTMTVD